MTDRFFSATRNQLSTTSHALEHLRRLCARQSARIINRNSRESLDDRKSCWLWSLLLFACSALLPCRFLSLCAMCASISVCAPLICTTVHCCLLSLFECSLRVAALSCAVLNLFLTNASRCSSIELRPSSYVFVHTQSKVPDPFGTRKSNLCRPC